MINEKILHLSKVGNYKALSMSKLTFIGVLEIGARLELEDNCL